MEVRRSSSVGFLFYVLTSRKMLTIWRVSLYKTVVTFVKESRVLRVLGIIVCV